MHSDTVRRVLMVLLFTAASHRPTMRGHPSRMPLLLQRDLLAFVEVLAHCSKHRAKHLRRQHAGVGVVARAMIAREQRERADRGAAAMLEGRRRALVAERLHGRLMGDSAERH